MKYIFACLLGVGAFLVTTPSLYAHELEPGLYEITVRVELPNIIDPVDQRKITRCITREEISGHDSFQIESETPLSMCQRTPICMGGQNAGFQVICKGASGGVALGDFTLSKNKFSGTIEMKMGGKNMTSVERQYGLRIGDCRD